MTVEQYIARYNLYRADIEVVNLDGELIARSNGRIIPGTVLNRLVFRYDLIGGRNVFTVVGGA